MCGYNENCKCAKKHINVEGLFAKSKIGTFCQSFKNTVKVMCSANYCVHNENNECVAKEITVGNENASYRSETECDSFKSR